MNERYILRAKHISKLFPGVHALDDAQLFVEEGTVHALMGENGAGKSTLMKILMGMLTADSGEIWFRGQRVQFGSVHQAIKAGISMIHQELLPFPELTVAENIFMGNEPTLRFPGWLNRQKINDNARKLLNQLGSSIPAAKKMKQLSIAEMQLVEIAKALSNKAFMIIMDEPTSALSDREVNLLFNIIRDLKKQGIAIIYISHKMDEILQIADRVTVMRDGKHIATRSKDGLNMQELINLIVGRQLQAAETSLVRTAGGTILEVNAISGKGFRKVSFQLKRGEILGIAGLMGSGRTEIVHAIYGLERISSGTIRVNGKLVKINSPGDAIRSGIGLVSEDRKKFGLVPGFSIKKNISLSSLDKCSKGLFLDNTEENRIADIQIKKLRINPPRKEQLVRFLSGGNQQKVVMAKVLLNESDIIILDEPTRGIDIGAKTEIYRLIISLAEAGKAILMISSELPEILQLSDRVLVVHHGEIKAELGRAEATQELIMKYAMS